MTFPLPELGVHTAIFGGPGTGKSSLLKGICVEAARTRRVNYVSFEDHLWAESGRAGIMMLDPAEFDSDKLSDRLAESLIAIDAVQYITTAQTPFGLATSAQKVVRLCEQAREMGSSLVVTFQLNRTAAGTPEIVRTGPWSEFGYQWALNNRPDVDAPNGHLRAKCMKAASGTVGEVFSFRPWR